MPGTKRKAGKAGLYNKGAKVFRKYKKTPKTVAKQMKQIQHMISAEMGGMDTSLAYTPVIATTNTNAGCFVVNLIQQGNGSWNRVGRKVLLKSLRLRFALQHVYTTTAVTGDYQGNRLRCVVVWDKSPNGQTLAPYDTVFGLTDQTGAEATTLLSPIKYDNMDRFSILRDCVVCMPVTAPPSAAGTTNLIGNFYEIDEFVKLNGKETVFGGQSNPMTIADVSTGALLVYFRAEAQTASDFVTVNGDAFCRLRYDR